LRFIDPSGLEPDYFWITNGQGYYQALTREQFDAFLQDKERVQNWYPVPSGTIIPKENNQAFWGDVTPEFREENSRFLGYDVKINEQGHLEYANSMLYDGFPQEMSRYVEAHTKVMTIEITIMAFFTGPVGEVGGLTSLGLEGGGQVVARGSTAATSLIQENQLVGNAFRDEIGNLVRSAGREVETEVTKRTPFGVRRIDIEVSTQGKTLGGIETKVGSSRYLPSQRAKDAWLRFFQNLSGKCGSETLGQV